ncbi:MAG: Ribosomal RNA small subunit methyltransferase H [Chlamydiia bacterium]|nr:Ribosomal RNA small subunit methyltransferase H [Chlamydiia bacterium]
MKEEFLEYFEEKEIKVFFDGTLGAGGHAEALLQAHPEIEMYIGCDQDPQAIELASKRLAPFKEKLKIVRGNFENLDQFLNDLGVEEVDGFFLT